MKDMQDIIDYFTKIGIEKKARTDATPEQSLISKMPEEQYRDAYFSSGLDDFLDCIGYDENLRFFSTLLDEAKKYSDVLEPCCQSGILGCLVAQNVPMYHGIDINPIAIAKAKSRAASLQIDGLALLCADYMNYHGQHEAIIGRYFANKNNFNIGNNVDLSAMEFLTGASKNIILLAPIQNFCIKESMEEYRRSFEKMGYNYAILDDGAVFPGIGAHMFIMKAVKK